MKFLNKTSLFLFFTFNALFTFNGIAQDNNVVVKQDPKIEKLLEEKRKTNQNNITSDNYTILIFSGDNENAKKTLQEFRKKFKQFDSTIIFNTPSYKVITGNFKTRIEAERNLLEIKKVYKNALLIKPKD